MHNITQNDERVNRVIEPAYFIGVDHVNREDLRAVSAKYPNYFIVVQFEDDYDTWLEVFRSGEYLPESAGKFAPYFPELIS